MIEIVRVNQVRRIDFNLFKRVAPSQEIAPLIAFEKDWESNFRTFSKPGEGLFVIQKGGQTIGFGSVSASPNAPLTAGIGLINHCFIIPTERKRGYGNQLFKHLRQFAQLHFGLLQLKEDCPLHERVGGMMELV